MKLILALTLLASPLAFGQTAEPHAFSIQVAKIVDKCQQRHSIATIGGVDLAKLSRQILPLNWGFGSLRYAGSGGTRTGAVNINKTVLLNSVSPAQMDNKMVHLWLLHEALGALGHNDENYEISVLIGLCAQGDARDFQQLNSSAPVYPHSPQERTYQTAGGATVVGRGGDLDSVNLKFMMLVYFREWNASKTKDLNATYNSMRQLLILPVNISPDAKYQYMRGDAIPDFFVKNPTGGIFINRIWSGDLVKQEIGRILEQIEPYVRQR